MEPDARAFDPICPECGKHRSRSGTTVVDGKPRPLYAGPCGKPCSTSSGGSGDGCILDGWFLLGVMVTLAVAARRRPPRSR